MKTDQLKAELDQNGFTLVELLVVMTIILILAGVMTPAVMKVVEIAKIRNAEQVALQLVTSISSYQSDYNRFPLDPDESDGRDILLGSDEPLMDILLGADNNRYNPKGENYFSGRNARGRPPRNGLVFNQNGGGKLYDPWGNLYQVMMDTDINHRIEPPFQKHQMKGANLVAKKIIVWSLGPDGEGLGEGVRDNIITW